MTPDMEIIAQYTPQQLRDVAAELAQKAAERKISGKGGCEGHTLIIACLRFCADVMDDEADE